MKRYRRVLHPIGIRWLPHNAKRDPGWQRIWSPEIKEWNNRMHLHGLILIALILLAIILSLP